MPNNGVKAKKLTKREQCTAANLKGPSAPARIHVNGFSNSTKMSVKVEVVDDLTDRDTNLRRISAKQ